MQKKLLLCILMLLTCLSACQGNKKPAAPEAEPTPATGGTNAAETPSPTETPSVEPSGGAATPSVTHVPPGTLPEVASLPEADPSLVGTQCTLRLMETKNQCFAYYYDEKSGCERLVTVPIPPASDDRIPDYGPLTVYETTLGGVDGLREAVNGETEATVLAVVNISFQEIMAAWYGVLCQYEETDTVKRLALDSKDAAQGDLGRFFGGNIEEPSGLEGEFCQPLPDGQYVILWEVLEEKNNLNASDMDEIFRRIYKRFGLTELVLGDEAD